MEIISSFKTALGSGPNMVPYQYTIKKRIDNPVYLIRYDYVVHLYENFSTFYW
jgi:hypothetical protein